MMHKWFKALKSYPPLFRKVTGLSYSGLLFLTVFAVATLAVLIGFTNNNIHISKYVVREQLPAQVAYKPTLCEPGNWSAKKHNVVHDNRDREYYVSLPSNWQKNAGPYSVILMLHGGGSTPCRAASLSGLDKFVAQKNLPVITVYPHGVDESWNAGDCGGVRGFMGGSNCGGTSNKQNIDDVGFLMKVVDSVITTYSGDPNRVYIAGASNGSMMTHRMLCEKSSRFAAAVTAVGSIAYEDCDITKIVPTPIIQVAGLNDEDMPYYGGAGLCTGANRNYVSMPATRDFWIARNNANNIGVQSYKKDTATCTLYSANQGGVPVEECVIAADMNNPDVGGHSWPGVLYAELKQSCDPGCPCIASPSLELNERMWNFFTQFSRDVQPELTLSVSKNSVQVGDDVELVWNSKNTLNCIASGDWVGNKNPNGTEQVRITGNATFDLTCETTITGMQVNSSVVVTTVVPPGPAPQTQNDLLGYAWSSNFGWVSFSCENTNACGGAAGDWGVTLDTLTGKMGGYAWGSTGMLAGGTPSGIGWVSFNDTAAAGCELPGTPVAPAQYDAVTKRFKGFARACSVFLNPGACSGQLASPLSTGGWDGCIKLDPQFGGVSLINTGVLDVLTGYAWDASAPANMGIGWLDFCPLVGGVANFSTCVHLRDKFLVGLVNPTLFVSKGSVDAGARVTLNWQANDPAYDTCTVVQGGNAGFETNNVLVGSDETDDLQVSTIFQIECTDTDTNQSLLSNTILVVVNAVPVPVQPECSNGVDDDGDGFVDFPGDVGCSDANDDSEENVSATFTVAPLRIKAGGTVTVSWQVGGVDTCTLTQSGFGQIYNGQLTTHSVPGITVLNSSQSLFTLTCTGVQGVDLTRSVRVVVDGGVVPL